MQGIDQLRPPLGVLQQVVLQIRVACHHPDVAQDLIEHLGRTTGATLLTELGDHLPTALPQDPQDDLAIGERGVVVGNLTQARLGRTTGLGQRIQQGWVKGGVHRTPYSRRSGPHESREKTPKGHRRP